MNISKSPLKVGFLAIVEHGYADLSTGFVSEITVFKADDV